MDRFFEAYDTVVGCLKDAGYRPATKLLGVTRLVYPELLIEIAATAVA